MVEKEKRRCGSHGEEGEGEGTKGSRNPNTNWECGRERRTRKLERQAGRRRMRRKEEAIMTDEGMLQQRVKKGENGGGGEKNASVYIDVGRAAGSGGFVAGRQHGPKKTAYSER